MKKLLLSLIIITSANSLYGMELQNQLYDRVDSTIDDYSEFFPITLPQIYHYLSELLNRDIAYHIFSLQPGSSKIHEDISCLSFYISRHYNPYTAADGFLQSHIKETLKNFGYCYAFEQLNKNLIHREISICDVKNHNGETVLYRSPTETIKFFLQFAGSNVWTLLTMQKNHGYTALHYAAGNGYTETVKLLLDAAGKNVWAFLAMKDTDDCTALYYAAHHDYATQHDQTETVNLLLNTAGNQARTLIKMRNRRGKTAFDVAIPTIKEIMKPYLKKNSDNCLIS